MFTNFANVFEFYCNGVSCLSVKASSVSDTYFAAAAAAAAAAAESWGPTFTHGLIVSYRDESKDKVALSLCLR